MAVWLREQLVEVRQYKLTGSEKDQKFQAYRETEELRRSRRERNGGE